MSSMLASTTVKVWGVAVARREPWDWRACGDARTHAAASADASGKTVNGLTERDSGRWGRWARGDRGTCRASGGEKASAGSGAGRLRSFVMPSGAPEARRRGIAIIPVESPRRRRTADADYADYAVALRAIAETAKCVSRLSRALTP